MIRPSKGRRLHERLGNGLVRNIKLPRKHASLLLVLWEQEGARVQGDAMMRQIDIVGQKPVDVFKRANYPNAHRSYTSLARNHYGDYWLLRA